MLAKETNLNIYPNMCFDSESDSPLTTKKNVF